MKDENGKYINLISYEEKYDGNGIFTANSKYKEIKASDSDFLFTDESKNNVSGDRNHIFVGRKADLEVQGDGEIIRFSNDAHAFVGLSGKNELVENNDSYNLVNINGDGSSVNVNGDVSIGLNGNNQSAMLKDAGDHLTVYGSRTGESVFASGDAITLDDKATATVYGGNNTIGFTGQNSFAAVLGTGEVISNDDASNLVNLDGDGSSANIYGRVGIGLYGSKDSVTLNSAGTRLSVYGGFTGERVFASGDAITLDAKATADVFGGNNTIGFTGQNGYAGVFGTGEVISNDDASNLVNLGGDGSSASVYGRVSVGLYGSKDSVWLENAGTHLSVYGGFTGERVFASGDAITLDGKATADVFGGNNTIGFTGQNGYAGVFGTGEVISNDDASNLVNLGGDGSSASVYGRVGIGLYGSKDSVTLNSAGTRLSVYGGFTDERVFASGDAITLDGKATADVFGANNTIGFTGQSGYAGVFGTGEVISNDDASNLVNLGGDGSSASVYGRVSVGLYGSKDSVWLENAGTHLSVYGGFIGERVFASGDAITLDGKATADVFGANNTIGFTGQSGYAGVFGTGEVISNDDASNLVNLGGDGSSASVYGRVGIGLYGSNDSVTLNSAGTRLAVYNNFTGETVYASGDDITVGSKASANVFGSGDSVHLAPDGGAYVGLFGQGEVVTGDSGSDLVNLGGDTSATIYGGGVIGLCGSGDTLTIGDAGSTVNTLSNLTNEVVNGDHAVLNFAANVDALVRGSSDVITGSGDFIEVAGDHEVLNFSNSDLEILGSWVGDTFGGTADSYFSDIGRYLGGFDATIGWDWGDLELDPVVLNLQGGAVQTVGVGAANATFDAFNDGRQVATGWGTAGEGYLVHLPADKTAVTRDSDLVASFAALRQLDSNRDGRLDAADAAWSDLKVWIDPEGHADPTRGRLVSVSDLGLRSIDLHATPHRHVENGNTFVDEGRFTWNDGTTGAIAGVAFQTASSAFRHDAEPSGMN
ncbi:beta strand repeat-containing protein [Methylobacterium sp. JK268]